MTKPKRSSIFVTFAIVGALLIAFGIMEKKAQDIRATVTNPATRTVQPRNAEKYTQTQNRGTDRQLHQMIKETNEYLGESRDMVHSSANDWQSIIILLQIGTPWPQITQRSNALRRKLHTQRARYEEIAIECRKIARKIKQTTWPSHSDDPGELGSFAQRAMESAKNCATNAKLFQDGNRDLLASLTEAGL